MSKLDIRNQVGGLPPSPNELYYNILIKNNNVGSVSSNFSAPAVPVVFQETRSNPYINPANEYYMSVVSFEIDTQAVPIFICDAIPGSLNLTDTPYAVTVQAGNSAIPASTFVVWNPEDTTTTPPPTPVPNDYDNYPYYYSYTFQHFIQLVNNAIFLACQAVGGVTHTPFISFNNNKISLVANVAEFSSVGTPPAFTLYFNSTLFNLFSSLTAQNVYDPLNLEANHKMIFYAYPDLSNVKPIYTNLATVPPSNPYDAIYNDCEYSPLPYWNPVDSIVFQTQQLTIVPELIAKPVSYGTNNQENVGVNADSYYVLTDYSVPLINGTEYKPSISYVPQAEYRLAELYGEGPLNSIFIEVFWKDKFGSLHPLLLEVGGTAYIKIMFRKKTFYGD